MADIYNLSQVDAANNIYELFFQIDSVSGGYISIFLLATLFIAIMIVGVKYDQDTKTMMIVASFITTLVGVLMLFANMITSYILFFPIAILIASLIIFKLTGE